MKQTQMTEQEKFAKTGNNILKIIGGGFLFIVGIWALLFLFIIAVLVVAAVFY